MNTSILWPYWNLVCNRAVKCLIPTSCRPQSGSPYCCCVRARVHLRLLITTCHESVCTDLGASHKGCFTLDQTDPYTFDNKCYLKFHGNINIGSKIAPSHTNTFINRSKNFVLASTKRGPWSGRSTLTVCFAFGHMERNEPESQCPHELRIVKYKLNLIFQMKLISTSIITT